jgi:anti-anti-sigma regulatory factor
VTEKRTKIAPLLTQTDLKVETRVIGSNNATAVVQLRGYISPSAASDLQGYFSELSKNGVSSLLLDMRDVTRICSAGIALLVSFRTKKRIERSLSTQNSKEPLVLISPSLEVDTVLKELGISSLFPCFTDQPSAFIALGLEE